jgi:4-hydroxybenzoate polyprenyltransferase
MIQPVRPASIATEDKIIPLCVDLDDTLIRTDTLWEALVQVWRYPAVAVRALMALLLGNKAAFKTVLAEAIAIDPAILPYREDVLIFCKAEHTRGREIVLATATHRRWAQAVADHLGIFRRVYATDGGTNLSSTRKRDALDSAYGKRGFDYIGDHENDLPIFAAARQALLVNPSGSLLQRASAQGNVSQIFRDHAVNIKTILRALRLHQWAKNALLAVPLLSAHLIFNADAWIKLIVAFIGFGLVASATYVVNDLLDLGSDRIHSRKRFRPLASGHMSIRAGLLLAVTTGLAGFTVSFVLLPPGFGAYVVTYLAVTLAYSVVLKQKLLIDALTLAMLYTLRILAGGAAVGVVVSEWLLMFSLFLFLSLAFLKRIIELGGATADARIAGRGYSAVDLETVRMAGISSGLIAVMVLSLYIGSPAVNVLYRCPQILWLLCPLLIYWILRIWILAARNEVDHDPVVFALLDRHSYLVGAFGLLIVGLAKISPVGIHW